MKRQPLLWKILGALVGAVLTISSFAEQNTRLNQQQALKLATEAYIYGYPLITMDVTRQVMTNVTSPHGTKAPMGQFVHLRTYPDATFKDVTAPNADTLYSAAWLDLSKEPYILHVPDEKGRYYLMPMLSGWTNVFAAPGTRTTGTKAHDFAIIGPRWKGALPQGVIAYHAPTNMVWILGRTYSTGTPQDYQAVHAIQNQYTLTPLSFYGKPYTPSKGTKDHHIDTKTPVRDQVNAMDAATFFSQLAILMKNNPPAPADAPMVAKLTKLGIVPGQPFDINKLDPVVAKALQDSVKAGQQQIMAYFKKAGEVRNGWVFTTKTGSYGTDYIQRALVAAIGLGANLPQDAIYPTTTVDSEGNTLNGKQKYIIHFAKGQMPPVKGFWSLTMYDPQYFFVSNIFNRYSLSARNALKQNPDGSVDLYIQKDSPGIDKESNWLPAPEGNFILMFRFYWPKESIINGSWTPPAVKQVT